MHVQIEPAIFSVKVAGSYDLITTEKFPCTDVMTGHKKRRRVRTTARYLMVQPVSRYMRKSKRMSERSGGGRWGY